MANPLLNLSHPPIVEAVVDIDCDMPPAMDLTALEVPGGDLFRKQYPNFRTQFVQEHEIKQEGVAPPKMSVRRGIQALQFFQSDEKQLVQVRTQGFSFNRLAPYSSLDQYLPEIERTWRLFVGLVLPVKIRNIRLRYINRILLPTKAGKVELNDYLKLGPRLADEDKLTLVGFLNQHSAVETGTDNRVNIVLTAQTLENDKLPVILDITAFGPGNSEPNDWLSIQTKIQSLRALKNLLFRNTLTARCLKLFR